LTFQRFDDRRADAAISRHLIFARRSASYFFFLPRLPRM